MGQEVDKKHIEEEEEERETWGNPVQFFLATLGYSIGMGAMTRFPYVVLKNGGGAFLIPFLIFMLIAGAPLFYMEVILGQFSGKSPLKLWELSPAFRGLGVSCTLLSGIVALYYMPLTWSALYMVLSIGPDVPWKDCGNYWNTDNCYDPSNDTAYDVVQNSTEQCRLNNNTNCTQYVSSTEEYWK